MRASRAQPRGPRVTEAAADSASRSHCNHRRRRRSRAPRGCPASHSESLATTFQSDLPGCNLELRSEERFAARQYFVFLSEFARPTCFL